MCYDLLQVGVNISSMFRGTISDKYRSNLWKNLEESRIKLFEIKRLC